MREKHSDAPLPGGNHIFRRASDEIPGEHEKYRALLEAESYVYKDFFFVGFCLGIRPEISQALYAQSYEKHTMLVLGFYDAAARFFEEQDIGFEVMRNADYMRMIGIFPVKHREDYKEVWVEPMIAYLEKRFQVGVCVGLGLPADSREQIKNTYKTAKYCFELYFFRQEPLIDFQMIDKDFRATYDDYDEAAERAFRRIMTRDERAMDEIDRVVDVIGEIHYGNWRAVIMRTMNWTGDLNSRFRRYRLIKRDFTDIQDELQANILEVTSLEQLKELVHRHYEMLLDEIYRTDKPKSKDVIERIKKYINENYMKDITVERLSELACVSPNYFSHMFRNETGQNFKAYLTGVRMNHALVLLMNTDDSVSEVSDKVGYRNPRSFVDAFKQTYSVSPMNYKKRKNVESFRSQE